MVFIICTHKRSRPKVSLSVCEKCKRIRKCPDYKDFQHPPLFPNLSNDVIRTWAVRKKGSIKTDPKEITEKQEQLIFNCVSPNESKED